jgi:type II secretory pathway component PulK
MPEILRDKQAIRKHRAGTVLFMVLWSLALLTVFSVHIGLRIRHKMTFLERIQDREQLRSLAVAGIHKARSLVLANLRASDADSLLLRKMILFNNPQEFQNVNLGQGAFDITCRNYDEGLQAAGMRFGLVDEQGKININTVNRKILENLMLNVLTSDEDLAKDLATAIYDWRVFGESEIIGFFSDEYYDNLDDPYEEKKGNFETPAELLAVRGFTNEVYGRLKDFITIYGNGAVNANTASRPVLKSLGLSDSLVTKILSTRRGKDDVEATIDDVTFNSAADLTAMVDRSYGLSDEEKEILSDLGRQGLIGTHSQFLGIPSIARLDRTGETKTIDCIFNMADGQIVYWRE